VLQAIRELEEFLDTLTESQLEECLASFMGTHQPRIDFAPVASRPPRWEAPVV
jgi:hypothetical protein